MASIRWRSVVLFSALLASGGMLAVWGPVWKHEAEVRERARAEELAAARALDESELAKCSASERQYARERYPESADEGPDFSMFVMGGFGNNWRVSVTGKRVTLVQMWSRRTGGAWSTPIGKPVRLEGHAVLTPAHARELNALMRERINNASGEPGVGFDGASFVFESGEACASTWMPHEKTGAGRLVTIAHILANQASTSDARKQAQVEQLLLPYIRSFGHRGADEAVQLPRSEYLYSRGPDWDASVLDEARSRSQ
jgi:hypothetical protein